MRVPLVIAGAVCLLSLAGLAAGAEAQASLLPKLEEAAKGEPRDFEAQWSLAQAHLRAGQVEQAERVLSRAKRLAPSDSIGMLRMAEVWLAAGDYKRARNRCRSLLHEREDPLARLCLAKAYLAWNRSSKAFEELSLIEREAPELVEAQLVLGEAHRLRSSVPEAEAAYENAMRDPALRAEAQLGLGRLYAAVGRHDEAIGALRGALSETALPAVQYELARLLGPTEEAEKLLVSALENRLEWPDASVALGDVLLARGEPVAAERAYRRALQVDTSLYTAHRGLGRALLAQGDVNGADAALSRALSLFPNDPTAQLALGEVRVRQGRIEEALQTLRQAADREPQNPAGLLRAAQVCIERGRHTLAAGYLDRLLAKHPRVAAGLAAYGDVTRAFGERDRAREYYRRALDGEGPLDRGRVEAALSEL